MVYLDEVLFTKRTFLTRCFTGRNVHTQVDQNEVMQPYKAVIAAVSAEEGMEFFQLQDTPATNKNFPIYIKRLSKMLKNKPFALYLDQLRCHKSNVIKTLFTELDILPIYNVSYSPEFNPIESVFSLIKLKFRQQRLNKLANEEEFDVDEEIEAACNVVTPQLVQNCAKRSYALLNVVK